jgi:hypothetical protein
MAEPSKCVLLVDFDSLHRSLTAIDAGAAGKLAARAGDWVAALEAGRLVGPARRVMVRRCYADPALLGDGRHAMATAGFEIVDCPAVEGGARNPADMHLAIDAADALGDEAGYEEFIILSADADLSPLLGRIKSRKRRAVIYAGDGTPASHRALADGVVESTALAAFLAAEDAEAGAGAGPSSAERNAIEAFARRMHATTNIPLFSPRTFAELFRHLTEEIAANGYHFQTTARNVADRLTAAGRNVNRRQVVFIVKGLALKGHVFSTSDTPERLAEVFREQAAYLIGNAGLTLDEDDERLLTAWIAGRSAGPAARTVDATPAPARPAPKATPAPAARPAAATPAKPPPQARASASATPAAKPAPQTGPAAAPAKRGTPMISPEEARAAIAARIPPPARPKPDARTPGRAASAASAKSGTDRPRAGAPDALEDSILAAIAEAVDVLVEDSGGATDRDGARDNGGTPPPRKKAQPQPAPAAARKSPGSRPEDPDDDIGNEIQRIIASYNRNRKDKAPG